jgi:hypothetical protein
MSTLSPVTMDKTFISISHIFDPSDESKYWLSKTIEERLQVMEYLREINYGKKLLSQRIRRVLEITPFPGS